MPCPVIVLKERLLHKRREGINLSFFRTCTVIEVDTILLEVFILLSLSNCSSLDRSRSEQEMRPDDV